MKKGVETKITAKFLGRRTYKIKVKQGKNKVRRIIYISLFHSPEKLYKDICKVTEELLLMDYEVTKYAIYKAIRKEAVAIEDSIPDWYLDILYDDLY